MIRNRINEKLPAELWSTLVADAQGRDRREVAAGAVAADRDARGIRTDLGRARGRPARRGQTIVCRGGKLVFRRQAVIDRQHGAIGALAQIAAQAVVGVEVAQHEAAAVEKHEERQPLAIARLVKAHRQCARGPRNGVVRHMCDRRGGTLGQPRLTRESERCLPQLGHAAHDVEEGLELRIERHAGFSVMQRNNARACGKR